MARSMSARTSLRQLIGTPDDQHANVVSMDGGKFLAQIFAKQAHQKIDFRFGAAPVFHGKSVESQGGNSEPRAGFNHRASRLNSRAMSGDARQVTALRPAAVSIHDDGNMLREPVRIQIEEQTLFFKVRGFERFRCFHATIPANSVKWTEAVSRASWKANIGHLTAQHSRSNCCLKLTSHLMAERWRGKQNARPAPKRSGAGLSSRAEMNLRNVEGVKLQGTIFDNPILHVPLLDCDIGRRGSQIERGGRLAL